MPTKLELLSSPHIGRHVALDHSELVLGEGEMAEIFPGDEWGISIDRTVRSEEDATYSKLTHPCDNPGGASRLRHPADARHVEVNILHARIAVSRSRWQIRPTLRRKWNRCNAGLLHGRSQWCARPGSRRGQGHHIQQWTALLSETQSEGTANAPGSRKSCELSKYLDTRIVRTHFITRLSTS